MNGFNDEDMGNRYDLGFEDGKLSAERRLEQLRAENERQARWATAMMRF